MMENQNENLREIKMAINCVNASVCNKNDCKAHEQCRKCTVFNRDRIFFTDFGVSHPRMENSMR